MKQQLWNLVPCEYQPAALARVGWREREWLGEIGSICAAESTMHSLYPGWDRAASRTCRRREAKTLVLQVQVQGPWKSKSSKGWIESNFSHRGVQRADKYLPIDCALRLENMYTAVRNRDKLRTDSNNRKNHVHIDTDRVGVGCCGVRSGERRPAFLWGFGILPYAGNRDSSAGATNTAVVGLFWGVKIWVRLFEFWSRQKGRQNVTWITL